MKAIASCFALYPYVISSERIEPTLVVNSSCFYFFGLFFPPCSLEERVEQCCLSVYAPMRLQPTHRSISYIGLKYELMSKLGTGWQVKDAGQVRKFRGKTEAESVST